MELGLSLGDTNTAATTRTTAAASSKSFFLSKNNITSSSSDHQNHSSKKKRKGIGFCMALGINSSNGKVQEQHEDDEAEKSNGDDDEDDEHTSEEGNTPVQLDLLPLVPVPRRNLPQSTHWSSDNGKYIHIPIHIIMGFSSNSYTQNHTCNIEISVFSVLLQD